MSNSSYYCPKCDCNFGLGVKCFCPEPIAPPEPKKYGYDVDSEGKPSIVALLTRLKAKGAIVINDWTLIDYGILHYAQSYMEWKTDEAQS